jgi:hypothetical protein
MTTTTEQQIQAIRDRWNKEALEKEQFKAERRAEKRRAAYERLTNGVWGRGCVCSRCLACVLELRDPEGPEGLCERGLHGGNWWSV